MENTRAAYLTSGEAANYLGVSMATLRQWRCRSKGPKWRKLVGIVQYRVADLIKWEAAMERRGNTEE